MKISEIINYFETIIPLGFQETYDNCGLQVGNSQIELTQALITLDITEPVIDEAIEKKCNLIISHHPLIFHPLKKITGSNPVERILEKAIKADICVYCAHTSLDNNAYGLNTFIAAKLGLHEVKILEPVRNILKKLVVFCPVVYADKVRTAIFSAGAGHIGNYDSCSFNVEGQGSFRAKEDAHPFVGELNTLHYEPEVRIETIFLENRQSQIVEAMLAAHPYEEVAYDIYPLNNEYNGAGAGIIGNLEEEMTVPDFLVFVRKIFKSKSIRVSEFSDKKIKKVAFCGGSGSFLVKAAIRNNADMLMTADIKYHEFSNDKIILADIGHYESEYFSTELIASIIIKKFPTFAFSFSEKNSNPVYYF